MSIDLGNTPVGTPPDSNQKLQIRSAISAAGYAPSDGKRYAMQDGEWVYLVPPPNRAYDISNTVLFEEPSDIIPDSWTVTNSAAVASVSFKSTLTSIGDDAFSFCTGLTSVTIPNSVTSIGYNAFGGCSSLASATIGNSVTSIGSYAFSYCTSLTSITIPNSVTSIGSHAFSYCGSLENINIGSGVTTIGSNAFYRCSNLTALTVSPLNLSYSSIDGVLFDKDQITLLQYPAEKPEAAYTIPNSVETIASNGFFYCTSLTSVTIPDSVTSIGGGAFFSCTSLTSVTIPDSVTSIGHDAFSLCAGLTSVTIGNGVTIIGDWAFNSCTGLTSVTIGNSVTIIEDYAFNACTSLNSISCLAMVAPTLGANVFNGVLTAEIHVPIGATGYGTTYGGLTVVADL